MGSKIITATKDEIITLVTNGITEATNLYIREFEKLISRLAKHTLDDPFLSATDRVAIKIQTDALRDCINFLKNTIEALERD